MRCPRIPVAKKTRTTLLVFVGLLLAGSLVLTCSYHRSPGTVKKSVPVYSYTQQGNLGYTVRIRPNSIFTGTVRGPGETYYTKLVQSIDASCSYRYAADRPADLKVAYSVVATIDVPKKWHKDFVLVPQKELYQKGREISFSQAFPVNLPYFNDFLKTVGDELGSSSSDSRLVVTTQIYVRADSDVGTVRDKLAPSMEIPLTAGDFEVGGDTAPQANSFLARDEEAPDPGIKTARLYSLAAAVFLVFILSLFALLTRGDAPAVSEYQRQSEAVARALGDRTVRVRSDLLFPGELVVIPLYTLADLERVAGELGKPVLLQENGPDGPFSCLVIDGMTVYRYAFSGHPVSGERQRSGAEAGIPAPL